MYEHVSLPDFVYVYSIVVNNREDCSRGLSPRASGIRPRTRPEYGVFHVRVKGRTSVTANPPSRYEVVRYTLLVSGGSKHKYRYIPRVEHLRYLYLRRLPTPYNN